MASALKENTENIVKLNSVLDKTLQEAEKKKIRQCEIAIDLGVKAMGLKIIDSVIAIIAHNNVDSNKELVIGNISKLVGTEYYKLYSALSVYEINEVNVASKLKDDWIKELTDNIIAIVYSKQNSVYRITQLTNRIGIIVNEYSTYLNNKTFNA